MRVTIRQRGRVIGARAMWLRPHRLTTITAQLRRTARRGAATIQLHVRDGAGNARALSRRVVVR